MRAGFNLLSLRVAQIQPRLLQQQSRRRYLSGRQCASLAPLFERGDHLLLDRELFAQ